MMSERREKIASVQHDIWVHWMHYLFSCCITNGDGSKTIPRDKVQHWARQMCLNYEELQDRERDSDRSQADKVLKILE